MIIKDKFEVESWNENTQKEFNEENKINRAIVKQKYNGNMEGISTIEYVMYYLTPSSSKFVGIEYFEGTINGKSGRLTFQHNGKFENGVASSDFTIIHTTDELQGLSGEGSFKTISHTEAEYQIELSEA